LEELDIAVVRGKFDRSLFQVIATNCANLKKFHLKAKDFNTGENVDWTFLGGMKQLSKLTYFDL